MLTQNTQIPTQARGALRAFIRGHAGFDAWARRMGMASRDVRNQHLIDYALENGLEAQVMQIINAPMAPAPKGMGVADSMDEADAMRALAQAERQAEAEGALPVQPEPQKSDAADMASILAPVDAFLSPLVRAELEKALKPVVAAANKPPVEIERVVYQAALAPIAEGALPYATTGNKVAVGSLFGFKGGNHAKAQITTWESHGAAPAIDPFYVVDGFNMAMLATGIERGVNVWLAGPSGSGKTSMPIQFCAYTGRPCVKFSFTRQTEVADLLGGIAVKTDGSTTWEDGALIQAVKRPGTVIVLDELTIAPAGVQAIFHALADDSRSLTLPTGEKVICAPGVVFIVADNTKGFGDETGQYHGTNAANAALVNRFKRLIEVTYMSEADEATAIVNHTGCPLSAAQSLAQFIARARKLPEMENVVLSLRQMTGFIQTVQDGFTVKQAAVTSFLNRLPSTERAALETLFTLVWASDFEAAMQNKPKAAPAAPAVGTQASNSAAARAFDDETSASLNR